MNSELLEEKAERGPLHRVFNEVVEMKNQLARMESFISQAAALAAIEAGRIEEIERSFEVTVTALETQIREKDEALREKDSGLKELEENLTTRMHELENRLLEKEALLEVRETELNELRSKNQEAEALAAMETRRAEEIKQNLQATIAVLEVHLKEKEELVDQKSSALKEMKDSLAGLQDNLITQIRELEKRFEMVTSEKIKQAKRKRGSLKYLQSATEGSQIKE